jgi:SAM-dependent methyltransferase
MAGPAKSKVIGKPPNVIIGPAKKKKVVDVDIDPQALKDAMGITEECVKYIKAWELPGYRKFAPGEYTVDMFLEAIDPDRPKTLIDFGCGTGRAGYKLWKDHGFQVTLMDFAPNCLDDHVRDAVKELGWDEGIRFIDHDLTKKTAERAEYGYCVDVLEHLPRDEVDDALDTMLEACTHCFFVISTLPDHFGEHPELQTPLHLTVEGYQWWLRKFVDHGVRIHRSLERAEPLNFEFPESVVFFVSGYTGFTFDKLRMNTTAELVHEQIRENVQAGYRQLPVAEEQPEQKVVVLAGGPSLNDYVDEIKAHKAAGAKIVTMNGTYQWAREHDLWPVTQFMIDARPFNKRFVDPVDDRNLYVMASQVHPALLKKLPKDRTYLMQCNLDAKSTEILNEYVGKMYEDWFPIPGGSSCMLRTLPALQQLGFRDVEIYGFDSCLMDGEHHAYEQPENDLGTSNHKIKLELHGREFVVHPWMLSQAREFLEENKLLLRKMTLKVHGNGLIAHLAEHDANTLDIED